MLSSLLASNPARGAPAQDLALAAAVGAAGTVLLWFWLARYRKGKARFLTFAIDLASRSTGLSRWAALPGGVVAVSLVIAMFGFYWDVATHIDSGRDSGPFANAAHYPILLGLVGIAVGGVLSLVIWSGGRPLRSLTRAPGGALIVTLCGAFALLGFPLDEVWHRWFGQDVTLWGPVHVQMVAGASLCTLGLWVLLTQGAEATSRSRLGRLVAGKTWLIGGGFLIGLSSLHGEFDFGVPQFSLAFQPILLALSSSIGLVAIRRAGVKGDAVKAALFFIVVRGSMSLVLGQGLGHITLHLPLYLAEALAVEVIASRVRVRDKAFPWICGIVIGPVGLLAGWAWSTIGMPIAWSFDLVRDTAMWTLVAAVSGSIIGGFIGSRISTGGRGSLTKAASLALAVSVLCLVFAGTISEPRGRATVIVHATSEQGEATVEVQLDPPNLASDAYWFHVLSWQGGSEAKVTSLRPLGEGRFITSSPVPLKGSWKTMLRLNERGRVMAIPFYMPEDRAIPAPRVQVPQARPVPFVPDQQVLQRETIISAGPAKLAGNLGIAAIGLAWIVAIGAVLHNLRSIELGLSTTPSG